MFRTLIAAAYLLTIPGPAVWAQGARVVSTRPAPAFIVPVVSNLSASAVGGASNSVSLGRTAVFHPTAFRAPATPQVGAPRPFLAPAVVSVDQPLKTAVTASRPGVAPVLVSPAAANSETSSTMPSNLEPARGASAARAVRSLPAATAVNFDGSRPAAGTEAVLAAANSGAESAPSLTAKLAAPTPADPAPRKNLAGYLTGTFTAQVASNSLQVTMPLLFLNISHSAGMAAFAVTVGSALDALGTLVGGWLTDRLTAKPVLIATTVIRGGAMAALPLLLLAGGLTLPAVGIAYLVECFARGVADTARNTLPSEIAGRDDGRLRAVMAKNQVYFEAGGIAGPFIAGLLISGLGGVASLGALWLAPVVFAATTLAYLTIPTARTAGPRRSIVLPEFVRRGLAAIAKVYGRNPTIFKATGLAGLVLVGLSGMAVAAGALWISDALWDKVASSRNPSAGSDSRPSPSVPIEAASAKPADAPKNGAAPRKVLDGWMRWALMATALLTMYPLKGLLPAIFATAVLNDPASAAWLTGLFGVGGFLGSLAYSRWNKGVSGRMWLLGGSAGIFALAAAFLPGMFVPAALGILVFAGTNVAARLALNSAIQTRAGPGNAGSAMGPARFTANLTGLGIRFLAGLAFSASLAPAASFWIVGAGLAAVGVGALLVTGKLGLASVGAAGAMMMAGRLEPAGPRPSAVHGRLGRLIVVEGLDGSGKSTQMERLKEELESQGLKVVTTSWNSSDVVSEAVKAAKKDQSLTPKTFALMNAADLADRLEKTILPALDEGAIVLADRWFFTALARDSVRGNDKKWLRRLYADVPRPDLTLYFRLPVETAIGRVMARSEGKLGLSEDYEDQEAAQAAKDRRGLKYYEAGLDAKLSADPVENFRLFQTRVTAEYDKQAKEFGFTVIDSSRGRDEIYADVVKVARENLGNLASFKRQQEALTRENLFDKDPAGDADNIRRNYLHEKRGAHFYFRNMLLPMQERFAQLTDMKSTPRAFLHGSPHVDNYAKSAQGAAMVDFDRARVGPYTWDLVRLMVSISLRRKKDHADLLDADVLKSLKKGYLRGFRHPDRPFSEVRELKNVEPDEDEASMNAYLQANKKWAKEMRRNPLPVDNPEIVALVAGYAASQGPDFMKDWKIEEAGRGQGSMGFRGLYLVVLAPRDAKSGKDRILLNIKQVRSDPDTEWYKNPYPSETERMHAASELYAPGWAVGMGSAKLDGVEYDVRQISAQNVKIKKMMNREAQMDFAYSVGTQLGRAHRLSLKDATPAQLEAHFAAHFDEVVAAGLTIRDEIVDAHARYLRRMKREGLEPHGESEDE